MCPRFISEYGHQYPTEGDLAGEQLRRRGYLFSGDVARQVKEHLAALPPIARKAFALARAEALMQYHESLPAGEQRMFTQSWRPVLDAMWLTLAGIQHTGLQRASQALEAFYRGPYFPTAEPDGPEDADEDAAAASIFAAECFISGQVDPALHAAARCIDSALRQSAERLQLDYQDYEWSPDAAEPTPWAREHMQPGVQNELKRQLADLHLLERHGVSRTILEQLRG